MNVTAHAPVTMYATQWCPYCQRARELLRSKGVRFEEIDIESATNKRAEMQTRSGRHTVPQIFIGAEHVGGCDDLFALDASGGLDPLLFGSTPIKVT
jgi:glutaredoxin 3